MIYCTKHHRHIVHILHIFMMLHIAYILFCKLSCIFCIFSEMRIVHIQHIVMCIFWLLCILNHNEKSPAPGFHCSKKFIATIPWSPIPGPSCSHTTTYNYACCSCTKISIIGKLIQIMAWDQVICVASELDLRIPIGKRAQLVRPDTCLSSPSLRASGMCRSWIFGHIPFWNIPYIWH